MALGMRLKSIGASAASVAADAGKGALAGVLATAAMTVSSTMEAKLRGRKPSSAPADAAGKVLGVEPKNPNSEARFGQLVHWIYGTAWGGVGGTIRVALPEPAASVAHFAALWGTEILMLPGLDVAPSIKEWGAKEMAIDIAHHLVYVAAFVGVWHVMKRSQEKLSILELVRKRFI